MTMAQNVRVLYFDVNRCVGCHACETACKMENLVVTGPKWIQVIQKEVPRDDGGWTVVFMPLNCRHCGDPVCRTVCPTGAIQKRANGIVAIEADKCIGCTECLQACPFGAPQFGPSGTMQKCNMCEHRVSKGLPTACEQLCPVGAIMSGTAIEVSALTREKYLSEQVMRARSSELRISHRLGKADAATAMRRKRSVPA